MKEVSKKECIILGNCNQEHIQWKSLESTGEEDHQFICVIHTFLSQHVLESTKGDNAYMDVIFSSQN